VPEFGYRSLYDSKHRYVRLVAGALPRLVLEQKGLRERLLCQKCETRFSRYEAYAKKTLSGLTVPLPGKRSVPKVDYTKFKLFQLSLLWRAHVSGKSQYGAVDLPPRDAEQLRAMLDAEEPGRQHDYPCEMLAVYSGSKLMTEFVGPSVSVEAATDWVYALSFAGFYWGFLVSKTQGSPPPATHALRQSGSLPLRAKDINELPGLQHALGELFAVTRAELDRFRSRKP
jgi:hypothetical protein